MRKEIALSLLSVIFVYEACVPSKPNILFTRHQPVPLKVGKYTRNVDRNAEPPCHWNVNQRSDGGRFLMVNIYV